MQVAPTNKIIWDKVFKNGPSKICGRQPLPYPFKLFKGYLPQILPGPFLNTWTHMIYFLRGLLDFCVLLFDLQFRNGNT